MVGGRHRCRRYGHQRIKAAAAMLNCLSHYLGPRAGRKVPKGQVELELETPRRWRHASRDVAVGVYATASGIGATTTASLDPISWGSVAKSHRMRSDARR
jgi:hypothetical protein